MVENVLVGNAKGGNVGPDSPLAHVGLQLLETWSGSQ